MTIILRAAPLPRAAKLSRAANLPAPAFAPGITWRILGLCLFGAGFAFFAALQTWRVQESVLLGAALCAANAWLNCAATHASRFAMIAGVPVAWLGFLFYFWLGATASRVLFLKEETQVWAAAGLMTCMVALGFSLILGAATVVKLRALCPLCLCLHAVNLGLFVLLKNGLHLSLREIPEFIRATFLPTLKWKRPPGKKLTPRIYLVSFLPVLLTGMALSLANGGRLGQASRLQVATEIAAHFRQAQRELALDFSTPVWGNAQSAVTLVVFSDFQCVFCKTAALHLRGLLAELRGEVQLRFVHFPLDPNVNAQAAIASHTQAGLAAAAALCAEELGGFWEYHDDVFQRQEEISRALLLVLAAQRNWNPEEFGAAMDSERIAARLRRHLAAGQKAGVNGTPAVFVNGRALKHWDHPAILRGILRQELATRPKPRVQTISSTP